MKQQKHEVVVKKYNLFLSSSDKSSGTNNNFDISFNNSQQLFTNAKVYLKPISVMIANDWDSIGNKNNTFHFSNLIGTVVDEEIYLNDGSPSATGLATELQSALRPYNPHIIVSFNIYKKKLEFSTDDGSMLDMVLDFTGANSCHKVIGFNSNIYTIAGVNQYTAPNQIDLSSIEEIFVHSSITKRSLIMNNGLLKTADIILGFNTSNYTTGSNIYWENPSNMFMTEIDPNFSSIDIKIKDRQGNLIPFTNDCYLNFELEIHRENPSNEDVIQYLN